MNNLSFIILGIIVLIVMGFTIWKSIFKKRKKKSKSFMHHYHEEVVFKDVKEQEFNFEQVSVDHFNTASKGLKANKLEQKQKKKIELKINTPKMVM